MVAAVFTFPTSAPVNAAPANSVPPGRINSLVPADDEVSVFTGLPMSSFGPIAQMPGPPAHLPQRDECRALFFANTDEVWGSAADYAGYRSQTWTYRPDPARSFAHLDVGIYPTAAAARKAQSVYGPALFNTCSHAESPLPGDEPGITHDVYDFTIDGHSAVWTLAQKNWGQYIAYNCVFFAWHYKNVMSVSTACQFGNPSQTVKRLVDHVFDRIR